MPDFLLEIRSEEIPATIQDDILPRLTSIIQNEFLIGHLIRNETNLISYISPCRVVFMFDTISYEHQEELIRGPRNDANENQIDGFMKKYNVDSIEKLISKDGYYYINQISIIMDINALLSKHTQAAIGNMSKLWPRSMRWNDTNQEWIRPIRGIVCLYKHKIINLSFAGVKSNRISYGNKNIHPNNILIEDPNSYEEIMLKNYVMVDQKKRRKKIVEEIKALEEKHNVSCNTRENLLSEVVGLCEYPTMITGSIPDEYMKIPSCILVNTMETNQRYFLTNKQNDISSIFFLSIESNGSNIEMILHGNQKVLNARLMDALFFYLRDLDEYNSQITEKDNAKTILKSIPFSNELGTMLDRTERVLDIAKKIYQKNVAFLRQVDKGTIEFRNYSNDEEFRDSVQNAMIAILYSKVDLATHVVREFRDLQGYIGGSYAKTIWKLDDSISHAICQQNTHDISSLFDTKINYLPAILASIADKIEYIASHFYLGNVPTSSGDPFAVRRATNQLATLAISVINGHNIVIDIPLSSELLIEVLPDKFKHLSEKIADFLKERVHFFIKKNEKSFLSFPGLLSNKDKSNEFIKLITQIISNYLKSNNCTTIGLARKIYNPWLYFESFFVLSYVIPLCQRLDNLLQNQILPDDFSPKFCSEKNEQELVDKIVNELNLLKSTRTISHIKLYTTQLSSSIDLYLLQYVVNHEILYIKNNRIGLLNVVLTTIYGKFLLQI